MAPKKRTHDEISSSGLISPSKRAKRDEDEEADESDDSSSVDTRSTDGSDDGADLEGFIVKDEDHESSEEEKESVEENEVAAIVAETAKLTENLQSTMIGGRTLRARTTLKKPEVYFDHEAYAKITEAEEKREKLMMLQKWMADGSYSSDSAKQLTKKSSAEAVEAEYRKAKRAMEIDDTDDEEEDEEEEESEEFEEESVEDEEESESDESDDDFGDTEEEDA